MGIKTVAILGTYIYLCLPAIRAFLFTCSEIKETRTVDCEFSTTNTVQWYYKQKLINTCNDETCYSRSSNGRYFSFTGIAHKIIISNYTLDDCAMYGCKDLVSSEYVTFPYCPVPITFVNMTTPTSDKPVEILEGTMAEFHCRTSSGYPAAAVSWYKDVTPGVPGGVVPIRDNVTSELIKTGVDLEEVTNSTLHLYPSRADSGHIIYCSANNTAVHILSQRRQIIKVLFPITFVNMTTPTSDKPIEIVEGTMAEFHCRTSSGYPAATVSWYKDATPGVSGGVLRIRDNTTSDSVKTGVNLEEVTTSTLYLYPSRIDSGYSIYCSANNTAVHILSQRRPIIKVLFPITFVNMTTPTSDKPIEIVEGTMAEFHCRTSSGYPAAAVSWYKDATPGVPGGILRIRDNITSDSVKTGVNLEEVTTSTLYLYPSRIDSGYSIYCSANNTAVHILSQRRQIIEVLFPITSVNMTSPTSDNPIEIVEGTMAEFYCRTSSGYPAAVVSWYKDTTPGVPGGVVPIRDDVTSELVKTGVDLEEVTTSSLYLYPSRADSGHIIYCSANNTAVHIISQRRPLIKVLCVPDEPIGLSYSVSNNESELHWQPGFDGGLQQTFVVQLRKQSTDYWIERSIIHERETHLSLSLSFLDDGTNYTAMIYAFNYLGNSALTQGISFITRVSGTLTSDTVSSREPSFARYIGGLVGGSVLVINCVAVYVIFVVRKGFCSNHQNDYELNDQQRSETSPRVNDEHAFGDQSGMADQTQQNSAESHVYEELEMVREHADYLMLHAAQGKEEGIPRMTVETYENLKLN